MAAPGQTLEALVRDELRGPVAELVERVVRELVHERLNGAVPAMAPSSLGAAAAAPTSGSAASRSGSPA